MKVEIDTINKTIKVLDECTLEEFLEFMVGLENNLDYKLLPNTIINTMYIKKEKDLTWVQPYIQPWAVPDNPYKITCSYGTHISTNINQVK